MQLIRIGEGRMEEHDPDFDPSLFPLEKGWLPFLAAIGRAALFAAAAAGVSLAIPGLAS
jgi:hypothetical protein